MEQYFVDSRSIGYTQTSPERIIDDLYTDLDKFKNANLNILDDLKEVVQKEKDFLKSRLKERNGKIRELENQNVTLKLQIYERVHLYCNLETKYLDLEDRYVNAIGFIESITNQYNMQTERLSELEEILLQNENKRNALQQTADSDFTIITGFVQNEMPIDCPQSSSIIQSDDNFVSGYYTHNDYESSDTGSYDLNIHQCNAPSKYEFTGSNSNSLCKQKKGTRSKVNEKVQIEELVAPNGENQSVMNFFRSIKKKLVGCHGAKRNDKVVTHKRLGTSLRAFKLF